MRTLLTLSLAVGLAAPLAGAFAQTTAQTDKAGIGQSPSASETLNPSLATGAPPIPAQSPHDQDAAAAATGQRANASASLPVLPSNWGGDARSWSAHVKACKAHYKGYDPGLDQYPGRGSMEHCRLAMPKGQ